METKKYSSYAQIELELEILRVEREINLKKVILGVEKTKDRLLPTNLVKNYFGNFKENLPNTSKVIFKIAIPLLINWFIKRKRGN